MGLPGCIHGACFNQICFSTQLHLLLINFFHRDCSASIPLVKMAIILLMKKILAVDMTSSSLIYCYVAVIFHVRVQMLVRRGQIRSTGRVINRLKTTFPHNSHRNQGPVGQSIVLVTADNFRQFSWAFGLVGFFVTASTS